MKKIIFRYTGFIPIIALFNFAYAQNTGSDLIARNSRLPEIAYRNNAKESGTTLATTIAHINTKAVKDFSRTFKNVENAGWFILKDGYLAEFKKDGIKTKVFYDHKGKWVGNIRSYFEENMPRSIRHLVKSTYYDYKINYVYEVTDGRTIVYLVKLEDSVSFKTIRIQDGEMEESEILKKKE